MGVTQDLAPSFTQKPQLRNENEGNRLVFECQLNASPKPEVQWYREDKLIVEDDRTLIYIKEVSPGRYTVALDINDVVETDGGLYKVKAKNKLGEVSASINLNFSPVDEPIERQIDGIAPTFSKKPQIVQEEDGKRLRFECKILADPKPDISWFHDGVGVKSGGRFKVTIQKDGNSYPSTLQISDVTVEDAGKYKVTAKNELGESNATISLNFDSDEVASVPKNGVRPTFTERPVIRQSDDGSKVYFECRLVGDPRPEVQWFHEGKLVSLGSHFKAELVADSKLFYLASLQITGVTGTDKGQYKAVAKNSHGESQATINLNLEGNGKPKIPDGKAPRFPKKPAIRQEGEKLVMECTLEANPYPEITWYQGSKVIKDSSRIRIASSSVGKDMYNLTLEIDNPSAGDGGNYRCNAVNSIGESNANISLNFQGGEDIDGFAPTFVEKPKIQPNATGTLITMKCRCKAKPEPNVTWFKGSEEVSLSQRVKILTTPLGGDLFDLILEIKDPVGRDGGPYRCYVRNKHGESNAKLNLNIESEPETPEPQGCAPTFLEKPSIISSSDGKLVTMTCKVKADPKPSLNWTKEGKMVVETSRVSISVVEESEFVYNIQLTIKDPGPEDAGLYKCSLKNPFGELIANLTLNIEIAPQIVEKPKVIRIEKKTVVVECRVKSVSAPECQWYKESSVIRKSSKHVVHVNQVTQGEYAIQLEINEAASVDKGVYKLIAKNEKGSVTSQTVTVDNIPEDKPTPKGSKPQFSKGLKPMSVEEGKSAEFSVRLVSSDKSDQVAWYKNSRIVTSTKDTQITFDGTEARLRVSDCRSEHSGTYKVVIGNEFGMEESSAELIIKAKEEKEEKKKDETKKPEEVKKEKPKEKLNEPEKPNEAKQESKKEEVTVETRKLEVRKETKSEEAKVETKKQEVIQETKKGDVIVETKKQEMMQEKKKEETQVEIKKQEKSSYEEAKVEIKKEEVKVDKKEEIKSEQNIEPKEPSKPKEASKPKSEITPKGENKIKEEIKPKEKAAKPQENTKVTELPEVQKSEVKTEKQVTVKVEEKKEEMKVKEKKKKITKDLKDSAPEKTNLLAFWQQKSNKGRGAIPVKPLPLLPQKPVVNSKKEGLTYLIANRIESKMLPSQKAKQIEDTRRRNKSGDVLSKIEKIKQQTDRKVTPTTELGEVIDCIYDESEKVTVEQRRKRFEFIENAAKQKNVNSQAAKFNQAKLSIEKENKKNDPIDISYKSLQSVVDLSSSLEERMIHFTGNKILPTKDTCQENDTEIILVHRDKLESSKPLRDKIRRLSLPAKTCKPPKPPPKIFMPYGDTVSEVSTPVDDRGSFLDLFSLPEALSPSSICSEPSTRFPFKIITVDRTPSSLFKSTSNLCVNGFTVTVSELEIIYKVSS